MQCCLDVEIFAILISEIRTFCLFGMKPRDNVGIIPLLKTFEMREGINFKSVSTGGSKES